MAKKEKKRAFSKTLLIQESALIWIITIACLVLAYLCIIYDHINELPWLATIIACPWTAYAVSQGFYYKKSEKENLKGGIVYETALHDSSSDEEENIDEEPVG